MHCFRNRITALLVCGCIAVILCSVQSSARQTQQAGTGTAVSMTPRAVLDQYCITCHSKALHTAGLDLESIDLANPGASAEVLEKVILKLHAGSMPPQGRPRPDPATYLAVAGALEREIDRAWEAHPNTGR